MSVFVPVTDGVQVIVRYALDTRVISNRLWFTNDTPPIDLAALQGLTDGVAAWHQALVLPYLSFMLELLRVEGYVWDSDPPSLSAQTLVGLPGGTVQESHSANVSVVVPFKWPLGFRQKRNKHYVPGIPVDAVDLNTVTDGFVDYLYEAYAALIDYTRFNIYPFFTWRWRVASAFSDGVARTEQLVRSCQGPVREGIILGQRRKRMP